MGLAPGEITGAPDIITAPGEADRKLVQCINASYDRSFRVRWPRMQKNRRNWDFFLGKQDWSHKQPGQARIVLPDLHMAIHQVGATIHNHLVTFTNWFSLEIPGGLSVFDADSLRLLLQDRLDRLYKPGGEIETAEQFPQTLADMILLAIIESEVSVKVYGVDTERIAYLLGRDDKPPETATIGVAAEPLNAGGNGNGTGHGVPIYERQRQRIRAARVKTFQLGLEVIPFEDSFPDPSDLNRFHIHEVTRAISDLRANPSYDPAGVEMVSRQHQDESNRDKARRAGTEAITFGLDPGEVRVREFWGDAVDPHSGEVYAPNILASVSRDQLLREAVDVPFWHQRRPIVRIVLLKTPKAAVHRALMDNAVGPAEAENELTSLMVDGAGKSVWGVAQVRRDYLLDPGSIGKGIPQGFIGVLKQGVPLQAKFYERVDDTAVLPTYAMEVAKRLGLAREVGLAAPSLRLGMLPPRQVKATEVVEAQEASDNLFESIATKIEAHLETILHLAWLTLWQYLDDFSAPELLQILGPERTALLTALTPEERFYAFCNGVVIKVRGLRNLLSRIQDFRKLSTILNTIAVSPGLMLAWNQRFSTGRTLEELVRSVNLDPTKIEYRPGEPLDIPPEMLAGAMGGGGSPPSAEGPPSDTEGGFAEPNPTGERGPQL
jgi:hypothetical protein